jgi:hypothetical protein
MVETVEMSCGQTVWVRPYGDGVRVRIGCHSVTMSRSEAAEVCAAVARAAAVEVDDGG